MLRIEGGRPFDGAQCQCTVAYPGPSEAYCGGTTLAAFMVVLEAILRKQCDVADPCGQIRHRAEPDSEYDFIVCGLGSAGAVMASRLSEEKGWKVLGLEAGGNEPVSQQVPSLYSNMRFTEADWNYKTEPEKGACLNDNGVCSFGRGKAVGGTSVLNGMLYIRGNKKDFDNWEKSGCTGWSFQDVLPYFKKSENNLNPDKVDLQYHGVGGYLPIGRYAYRYPISDSLLNAFKELGYKEQDPNGETQTGVSVDQATSRNGIRYSTSRSFLRPFQRRRNLHIMLKTTVTKVLVDPKTKKAYGVEVITPEGKTKKILAKKEVIVSGGVINSPQILMLSGIGNKEDLGKVNIPAIHHLPGVGTNLHTHMAYSVPFTLKNEPATFDLNWKVVQEYILRRTGPMSSNGVAISAFTNSKYANASEDFPDLQYLFRGYQAGCAKTGLVGEIDGDVVNGTIPRKKFNIVPVVNRPKSTGYLTLRNNNPLSHPKIFPNYLTVQEDIDVLIEGVKFAIKLSETKELHRYGFALVETPVPGCENLTFGTDEYWKCAIVRDTLPICHQVGTCKMGPASDTLAVVDPELFVIGIANLRVIDSSIMPYTTTGNTNAPTIMIAEKGSDLIKKKWLQ